MRRLIPPAILAVMTVLAMLALGVSLRSAEKISYFSAPPAGNPAIVSIFRTVIDRSLDAPSFTFNRYLEYQAPDRTRTEGELDQVVIGDTLYVKTISATGATRWGRTPLTPLEDSAVGPALAKEELTGLLRRDSVVRTGDDFVVTSIAPAADFESIDPGQVKVLQTVYVSDDYVTSVVTRTEGWISYPLARPTGGYALGRVQHASFGVLQYGDYGDVAPIVAPPSSEVVPLVSCAEASTGTRIVGAGLENLCLPAT